MAELSYQAIRTAHQSREADELRSESRKKNLLILVLHYLTEEGYLEASNALSKETNLDMRRFEVCDNIDLETVLMEYESYYYIKFSKYPKVTKKLTQSGDERKMPPRNNKIVKNNTKTNGTPALPKIPQKPQENGPSPGLTRPKSGINRRTSNQSNASASKNGKQSMPVSNGDEPPGGGGLQGLCVQGTSSNSHDEKPVPDPRKNARPGQIIDFRSMINDATKMNVEEGSQDTTGMDKLQRPLGNYAGYTQEWRDLAQVISRDIYSSNTNVHWDDIIGLDNAKRLAKEAVVYPIKYPQLFTGILSPWKGLLLYGPPGTGKTLLAKAVATECKTTFFNISASSIVSKWRGDSEKLVRVLFELARFYAPSTIFIDELESLMSQRGGGGGGEHEGSRRMKTELLVQMDGLAKTDDLVFLLAASNLPWELDHAMLRRLEKRILVDLPTKDARKAMFCHHLPPIVNPAEGGLELRSNLEYDLLADKTEGYSGSDIKLVCKEAAMKPVRKVFDILEKVTGESDLHITLDTIQTEDVMSALSRTKPSAKNLAKRYEAWQKDYESV
ncbi:unnamed protein product [Owenia fusiformis]|uniref:Katanin p60 ATPase-containing subunit A-like 2 n=1 Tax=Owenia fusiformis TaxID=6347 RepID=A0A8J1TVA9_OWEFU|nr:unnamed protein product [Owenia fusiformis]